ncbi:MAG: membrane protein insertase YidC [Thermodesulfobacteriota bacterium]|nr:membrane protein insertase YidC [Thermodesulfobacteriota bacterium]
MDQIRMVLAVVLSILVFIVWDYFFIPDQPQTPPKHASQGVETPPPRATPGQEKATDRPGELQRPEKTAETFEKPEALPASPDETANTVVVETDLFTAELSEKGASVTRLELKKYKEENKADAPLKNLVSAEHNPSGSLHLDMPGSGLSGLSSGLYSLDAARENAPGRIRVGERQRSVLFSRVLDNGVIVEKKYTFSPDSYLIRLDVMVKNGSSAPVGGDLSVSLSRYFADEGSRFVFEGPSALLNGQLEEVKIKNIEKKESVAGDIRWVAIQNRYFMSAIIPTGDTGSSDQPSAMQLEHPGKKVVKAAYVMPAGVIAPNTMKAYQFEVFMGPKSVQTLRHTGYALDKAVNFGWFDFIAKPCLWLMNQIYKILPNYGIAIIIITLIFKTIFWPLGNKSYKSMGEMKKLQPLMAEIREKYKNDKKRMNEEMMNLYKTYKINPLGGCLPILVQIPVFIAFYRMLYQAIELRHAPFFLWIDDLSAPDRLFSFDVTIPFMHPPAGIPVLTLIMGATMFLQQKLQPAPGDPSQAKIMMLMPIMMTVIFVNFPSGLVLYWLVNNVVSIAQQHLVTNRNT